MIHNYYDVHKKHIHRVLVAYLDMPVDTKDTYKFYDMLDRKDAIVYLIRDLLLYADDVLRESCVDPLEPNSRRNGDDIANIDYDYDYSCIQARADYLYTNIAEGLTKISHVNEVE
jgi:hypothetical protein